MTKQEKKRLSAVLRATEYLFLENIALKLVLDHREVPNWQKLLDHLLTDQEMLAGVRLKFSISTAKLTNLLIRQWLLKHSWEDFQRRRRHTKFSAGEIGICTKPLARRTPSRVLRTALFSEATVGFWV
jgi:hypothetical protein